MRKLSLFPLPALHGALNPLALSRSFNTYFMVCSFITDTETHWASTAQLWGNSSAQLLNMEEEGKTNLGTTSPAASGFLRNMAGVGFCYLNSEGP